MLNVIYAASLIASSRLHELANRKRPNSVYAEKIEKKLTKTFFNKLLWEVLLRSWHEKLRNYYSV